MCILIFLFTSDECICILRDSGAQSVQGQAEWHQKHKLAAPLKGFESTKTKRNKKRNVRGKMKDNHNKGKERQQIFRAGPDFDLFHKR